MKKGNLKIELNLDYIEYTGKEKDKKVFFDRLARSVGILSKELLENNISFYHDGSFKISITDEDRDETEGAYIEIGDIIIFTPSNMIYGYSQTLPFIVGEKDYLDFIQKHKKLLFSNDEIKDLS